MSLTCSAQYSDDWSRRTYLLHSLLVALRLFCNPAAIAGNANDCSFWRVQCLLIWRWIGWQDVQYVNIYDILEPCYYPDSRSVTVQSNTRLPTSFRKLGERQGPQRVRRRMFGRAWPLRLPLREGHVPSWPQLASALHSSENVPCMVSALMPAIIIHRNDSEC